MSRTITIELTDEEVEFIERNWEPLRDDHPIFAARKKIYEALASDGSDQVACKVISFEASRNVVKVRLAGPVDGMHTTVCWGGGAWRREAGNRGYSMPLYASAIEHVEAAIAANPTLANFFKDNAEQYGRDA